MENNENVGTTMPENENQTQSSEKDYKQEFEKQLLEIEKLKNAISKTNSENAEYKKRELAKMTDDEKKAKEYQDLMNSAEQMRAELEAMKLEKEFLKNGFTAEETTKLIEGKSAPSVIAEIVKAKVDLAIKSVKAELIKEGTTQQPMGNGTTSKDSKTGFQKFQESNQESTKIVEL